MVENSWSCTCEGGAIPRRGQAAGYLWGFTGFGHSSGKRINKKIHKWLRIGWFSMLMFRNSRLTLPRLAWSWSLRYVGRRLVLMVVMGFEIKYPYFPYFGLPWEEQQRVPWCPQVLTHSWVVNLSKPSKVEGGILPLDSCRPITVLSIWWRVWFSAWIQTDGVQAWLRSLPSEVKAMKLNCRLRIFSSALLDQATGLPWILQSVMIWWCLKVLRLCSELEVGCRHLLSDSERLVKSAKMGELGVPPSSPTLGCWKLLSTRMLLRTLHLCSLDGCRCPSSHSSTWPCCRSGG